MEAFMKRSVLRVISFLICSVLCFVSFVSCDSSTPEIKKDEIPALAAYEFIGVKNVEVTGSEEMASQTELLTNMFARPYYVVYRDQSHNTKQKLDTVLCQDGVITLTQFYGVGNASYINGVSVYSEYDSMPMELGTYTGADVILSGSLDKTIYPFVDAYLVGEEFIIHVEENEEGIVYKYDLAFAKTP